jgi:Clp amino terminal domain, pathogenicity island component
MVPLLGLTRYTGPAQQVLVLAEQRALADDYPAISTGDMLLGLLCADHAVAAGALESLGITAEAVRRQLEGTLPAWTRTAPRRMASLGASPLPGWGWVSCRTPSPPWPRRVMPRRASRERLGVPTCAPERCWRP